MRGTLRRTPRERAERSWIGKAQVVKWTCPGLRSKLPGSLKGRSDEILTVTVPDRADSFLRGGSFGRNFIRKADESDKNEIFVSLSLKMEILVSYCAEKNGNIDRGDKKPGVCQY